MEASNIFDDDEKDDIQNGTDARVWIEVNSTDESKISADDKEEITKAAAAIMGDNPKVTYFDADLFKQVGDDGTKTKISENEISIKVTIKNKKGVMQQDK